MKQLIQTAKAPPSTPQAACSNEGEERGTEREQPLSPAALEQFLEASWQSFDRLSLSLCA